jgi:hypothetical protein
MTNRNFSTNFNDIHFNEDYENYGSQGEFKDKYKTKEEKKMVFINSKDINYLAKDTLYNFSINFSQGNSGDSSINGNFKNITNIRFVEITMRDTYINLNEINGLYNQGIISTNNLSVNTDSYNPRLERLSDLPYLILELTDINQLNYGSNNDINKSSFILKYDDDKDIRNNSGDYSFNSNNKYTEFGNVNNSIYAKTNSKALYFKNYGNMDMTYYPTPKGFLKNMKVTLKTPYGDVLTRMNDYLTMASIEKNSNLIKITMASYFSPEEYSLGDRIIFKTFSVTGSLDRKNDLETFINRSTGHRIIKHDEAVSDTKMYKSLFIPFHYDMILDVSKVTDTSDAATTYNVDDYGLSSNITCGGTLINSSQQIFFSLEITTELRDDGLLHGNII